MTRAGKLIILEGPDGVGKTTLAARLASHLTQSGIANRSLSFPGREPNTLGNVVYKIHHRPHDYGLKSIHDLSLQLLHLAAHIECITAHIQPALSRGEWVILDRYWWSMFVYGKVSGIPANTLSHLVAIESAYWGNHKPVIFLIDRSSPTDADTVALRKEYRLLNSQQRAKSTIVDNNGTLDESLGKILSVLKIRNHLRQETEEAQIPLALPIQRPMLTSLSPAKPTTVYDTYWRFAVERQNIFFRRQNLNSGPWTDDPILNEFKFTNTYRAADRVSQYLIRNVIYKGDQAFEEVFFRTILFKLFNRIGTWELLEKELGELSYAEFSIKAYDRVLSDAMARGSRIYSAAYIMPTGGQRRPKHQMHLDLLNRMMAESLPAKIESAKTMGQGFDLLVGYPTIGNFLAYQFITDLNYCASLSFSEMEFTIPGPGAMDGIRKCFTDLGGLSEAEIIKLVAERQHFEFDRLGLKFKTLWGRPLQLIDCQNIFCEVDKYSRVAHPEFSGKTGRTRIKQRFSPDSTPVEYWFPPKWGLNTKIRGGKHVQIV
jgi:thymidylate kinase